jgi:hypothetical protein
MAPTRNTHSLRSHGLPTMNTERPTLSPKVSTQATENHEIDTIEVQVPPKADIDTIQSLISVLTSQVTQLSKALEEQRIAFTRQYEALQTGFMNLKAEIATSISTQLSNVYVPRACD